MADKIYCYPGTDILINRLNIKDKYDLFEAEKRLTFIRLQELQLSPMPGNFDFKHLKKIHGYIFQDIYDWAGKERTVEIGKGNLFCTTMYLQEYADSVFSKYYPQCQERKDNPEDFIKALADNYGDLNALHPFREGNGRAQREFARLVCLACGYSFDLSGTTHREMLDASVMSFNKEDNSGFVKIFSSAVIPLEEYHEKEKGTLSILSSDDLNTVEDTYDYYGYHEHRDSHLYDVLYKAKIEKMNAEKSMDDVIRQLGLSADRSEIDEVKSMAEALGSGISEKDTVPEEPDISVNGLEDTSVHEPDGQETEDRQQDVTDGTDSHDQAGYD